MLAYFVGRHMEGKGKGRLDWRSGGKAVIIAITVLAAVFILLSGLICVSLAWIHRSISVWQMLMEWLQEMKLKNRGSGKEG